MPHAQIFTTDNNVRFSFDTGPFSHELLAGVDYSNYFERTFTASGMGTPIDIYNPVSRGVSVLPYSLLPAQRNTQLGLSVQDQIRYADRITLVVGGRHVRARPKTEGVDARIDAAGT